MTSLFLALALAANAQPAPDQQEVPQQETERQDTTDKVEDDRICRSIRKDMSSRRKERVCMTKDQWREFNRGN